MTDDRWEDYEPRVRANPRGTRPRSKLRPSHDDAAPGLVVGVDRGRYRVALADSASGVPPLTATLARELGRTGVVIGDRVGVVGDLSGQVGALARIVRVEDRRNLLRRSADDSITGERDERPIVANADALVIVAAAADPEPRVGLVDRMLLAALDAGIEPVLLVTKTDLADPSGFVEQFAGLDDAIGLRVLRSAPDHRPIGELAGLIAGRLVVLVGHSGVGKSTILNALVPDAGRATGDVNAVTGKGRHTSSSSAALPLDGGWIVDTPGVRSFGLSHVEPERIRLALSPSPDPGSSEAPAPPAVERLLAQLD